MSEKQTIEAGNSLPQPLGSVFVIVYHRWWMTTRGWIKETVTNTTEQQAREHAEARCHRESDLFEHWDYELVSQPEVMPLLPRRLTWCERITGIVSPNAGRQP